MSRRHAAEKREILPDPKFHNKAFAKFINIIMEDGKKGVAETIFYGAVDIVVAKTRLEPESAVMTALEKVQPKVEVKSRRVGGATYQVPIEVTEKRGKALAMRMLKDAASKRNEKTMEQRLANEMLDSINDRGAAVKKREDMHKMADANRAFAHFRW